MSTVGAVRAGYRSRTAATASARASERVRALPVTRRPLPVLAAMSSRRQVAPSPVIRVPFLRSDVHDLTGLRLVGDHLFGRA